MKLIRRVFAYGLMAVMLNSCFAPTSDTAGAVGSCAAANVTIFGLWKQVRGYPSDWEYGGVNPSKEELQYDFQVLIFERGTAGSAGLGQMCIIKVNNQGVNTNPNVSASARGGYTHRVTTKELEIDYTYPANAVDKNLTYTLTGCGSRPRLTLKDSAGREVVYEVYSRTVQSGQCANYTN